MYRGALVCPNSGHIYVYIYRQGRLKLDRSLGGGGGVGWGGGGNVFDGPEFVANEYMYIYIYTYVQMHSYLWAVDTEGKTLMASG